MCAYVEWLADVCDEDGENEECELHCIVSRRAGAPVVL